MAAATTPLLHAQHHRDALDEDVSTSSLASFDDSHVLESTHFGDDDEHPPVLMLMKDRSS